MHKHIKEVVAMITGRKFQAVIFQKSGGGSWSGCSGWLHEELDIQVF